MVNLILNAITTQLGKTFGKNYWYYVDDVEQGLQKPCFTADVLIPIQRSKSPILYDRTIPVIIHYFDDSKIISKKKLYDMGEQIVECLEYLPFDKTLLRGENIYFEVVENVLQVHITYKFTTKKVKTVSEVMETLSETVTHNS